VARRLLARAPDDDRLRERVAQLEREANDDDGPEATPEAGPEAARPERGTDDVATYLNDLLSWPGPDEGGRS
jgi:hypothetical protein